MPTQYARDDRASARPQTVLGHPYDQSAIPSNQSSHLPASYSFDFFISNRTEPNRINQGVNAALEDVFVLERALASCGDRVEDALPEYERTRAADTKAVVRVR